MDAAHGEARGCGEGPPGLFAKRVGRGPRVVLVHGFTQTHRSFSGLAARLGTDHEVVLVDAPGHGRSSGVACGPWEAAALLGQAGGRAVYVGYSMGARLCLHLALASPSLVRALVLVSGTAGIPDPLERARRREHDEALAASIEREGVAAFLERWLAQPLFATLPEHAAGLESRLDNTAAGLATSLRTLGTGSQESLWERLGELAMPVLVVVGARDARYRALASRLAAGIGGRCEVAVVEGAGHAVPLERPDAFVEVLRGFLGRVARSTPR